MKLLLGFVCVILGIIFGYFFSERYSKRKDFLSDLLFFNQRLLKEVSYTQNSIYTLFDGQTDFYIAIKDYFDSKNFSKIKYLYEDENIFVENYFKNIGNMDKYSQLAFLNNSQKEIESMTDKATKENKKFQDLYIKLGFLIGLIILVVLL